ncbi:MAG: ABC transporter permease [Brumimicrobium sp.]|nr:ABC transporter permease [Brumimicrobium sp.]
MNKTWLIAKREIRDRITSRSFLGVLIIGPLIVLGLIYIFLSYDSKEKQNWEVLLMDETNLFEGKLSPKKDPYLDFHFINDFVDYDEFANNQTFSKFDLAVWINEKVVSNKHVIIFYREKPSEAIQRRLVYHVERRLEEVMVEEFTGLSVSKFREIKQPLSFSLRDTYDPRNEYSEKAAWVGFTFGAFIVLFLLLFGMTILRSVSREKSNRIVEIMLASVSSNSLLSGKILGIGISAVIQVLSWIILLSTGLILFRMFMFPDMFSPEIVAEQLNNPGANLTSGHSPFVSLIFEQIRFGNMVVFFLLFFFGGYLFYGALFAAVGSSMGSESDGQQFIIPLNLLLLFSLVAGYFAIVYPDSSLTAFFGFLPFTSPVIMMIELANGFEVGESWRLYLALFILFVSGFITLYMAGRIFHNGILRFGHRLKLGLLLKWVKKS